MSDCVCALLSSCIKCRGATDDVNKGNLVERREISVERLTDAPQDTLYFCLADGIYKVLAWADYVPKEEPADWHFSTDKTRCR